ncbi:MAG: DUF1990 family protein [Armatimonadota bacterium]
MEAIIKARFEDGTNAPLSWSPTKGGQRAFICFDDHLVEDIGPDSDGSRFIAISKKMMAGDYYPPDAVQFYGLYQDEQRNVQVGERIQQRAPIFAGLYACSMVEIYVADQTENHCQIGYVTTEKHHGRGIWTATLNRVDGKLKLTVESTASPHSFLFWVGLPVARYLQLRARRRAIEEFKKL